MKDFDFESKNQNTFQHTYWSVLLKGSRKIPDYINFQSYAVDS